jgi:NAD(P)-dependent dehydrogenase (short-subunit alcohol dehydrogenase family)
MRLENKVAVITGIATGMGENAAMRFAKEGAKLVVGDINEKGGLETVQRVKDAGGTITWVPVNIADPAKVANFMQEASKAYGKIDILYNNAGIGPPQDTRVTDLAEETWDYVLGVNLRGTMLCCKYGIPFLLENGGSVINVASIAGIRANNLLPSTSYTVSKAGIIALTRQVAHDYAKYQVRVNAICPGPIRTPTLDPFFADPEIERRFKERIPLGRMGTTDDIVNLTLFLASDESAWITGSIINIDGGITS